MEQLYSIGTTNRYAMFIDDEDDPGDVILPPRQEAPATKTTTKTNSAKDNSKATKVAKGKENKDKSQKQNKVSENANKTSAPERVNSAGQRSSKQGPRSNGRGEKQMAGGDRPDNRQEQQIGEDRGAPRNPRGPGGRQRLSSRDNDRENAYSGEDRPPRGGRGSRPFRGGGRGGPRSGKREFERRSGSDKSSVKAVDKREGGGAHNWGKQDEAAVEEWPEDAEVQQEPQEPVTNGEPAPENKDKVEGEGGEAEETVEQEQEEDPSVKEMTLDEYKAQHNVETLKADTSLRRNVDNSQWKDTVALKKEDAEFFPGTREIIEKPKTSGRVKTTLDPNFYFKDQARRGRGRTSAPRGGGGNGGGFPREDRGGGGENRRNFDENRKEGGRGGSRRGGFGGGRGQGRFNNRKDRAPNVEDESDFPSLGAA